MTRVAVRSRGRPPVGERIAVRIAPEQLDAIDRRALALGQPRAAVIRSLLEDALAGDGVDRAQIRRMLRLSPAERLRRMADLAAKQARFRGAAQRSSR